MTPKYSLMPGETGPCRLWAEISGEALRKNARLLKAHTGAELMAVVKAEAYGHGLPETVAALRDDVAVFAVANFDEAREVRRVVPNTPVMLLSPCVPAERGAVVASGFIPTVSDALEAAAFGAHATDSPALIHLKIDTGMGRAGVWHREALREVKRILEIPGVRIHSLSSHLAMADEDPGFTVRQIADFRAALSSIRPLGGRFPVHLLNSAGALNHPGESGDWIRCGLALYGCPPVSRLSTELTPALSWRTQVLLARDFPAGRTISYGAEFTTPKPMRIASLSVGYADGFSRHLAEKGRVLIDGKDCPVVGRVTMDQIMVDVSGVAECHPGSTATLIGRDGGAEISVRDLAERAGTIPWEILTGIGGRTRRFYC